MTVYLGLRTWNRARCRQGKSTRSRCLSLLLTLLIGVGLGGCSGDDAPAKSDREFIGDATKLRETGHLHEAVNELKAALLANPRNTEARWMLGQVYLTLGEGGGSEKELRSAVSLGLDQADVVVPIANARMMEGDLEGALEVLDAFQGARGALLGKIMAARGTILWLMHDTAEAARAFQDALRASPPPIEAFVGDARLRYFNADLGVAELRLEQAADINDNDDDLACMRGQVAMSRLEMGKARGEFRKVLERAPEYARVRRCAYRNLLALGLRAPGSDDDIDGVRAGLQREFKDTSTIAFLEAVRALLHDESVVAQNGLEEFLQKQPNIPSAKYFLALAYAKQGQWQQAVDPIRIYRKWNPGDILGQRLEAIVRTGAGRFEPAADLLLSRLWWAPQDIETLALLGALALHVGYADLREDPLVHRVLDTLGSGFPIAPYALPAADRSLAVVGFWPWLQATAELSDREVAHVRSLMRLKLDRELDLFVEKLQLTQSERASTWMLKTLLALARDDDLLALRASQKAQEVAPDDPRVAYYAAYAANLTSRGYSLAERTRELLSAHPDFVPAKVLVIAAALRDRDFAAATKTLEKLGVAHSNPGLQALMVRAAIAAGDDEAAMALLDDARTRQPDAIELRLLDAELKAGVEDWEAVREALDGLPATYLHQEGVRRLIASAALALGQPEVAAREFEALLSARPNDPQLLEAMSRARLAAGDGQEALRLARHLQTVQTGDVSGFRLEGDVLRSLGQYRDAVFAYQSAYNLAPDRGLALALSETSEMAGELGNAVSVIDEWLLRHPRDFPLRIRLAELHWRAGRHDMAHEIIDKLLAGDDDFEGRAEAEALRDSWREAEAADVTTQKGESESPVVDPDTGPVGIETTPPVGAGDAAVEVNE